MTPYWQGFTVGISLALAAFFAGIHGLRGLLKELKRVRLGYREAHSQDGRQAMTCPDLDNLKTKCPACNAELETCDIVRTSPSSDILRPRRTYCSNCDICYTCDNRISDLHVDGCRCDGCQNRNEVAAERAQGDAWAGGFADNH